MLTFLLAGAMVLAVLGFGMFALPLLIVGGVLWLVTLPIRLLFGFVFGGLFRLFFGLLGGLFSLILIPLVMVVAGVALVGAFVAALVALVAPLVVPLILLLLLGWGYYRVAGRRPQASMPFLRRDA
jgi:hypothetical protein